MELLITGYLWGVIKWVVLPANALHFVVVWVRVYRATSSEAYEVLAHHGGEFLAWLFVQAAILLPLLVITFFLDWAIAGT